MSSDSQHTLGPMELQSVHTPNGLRDVPVNKLHRLADVPMHMAKKEIGAAIKAAIGDDKLEAYGHAGMLSAVCSGEKVPDYLARIYANEQARQRLGIALLEGMPGVELETTVRIKRPA